MKKLNKTKVLNISFGEDGREAEVEISFNYYKSSYGDDADGNRGIPCLELGSYTIDVSSTADDNSQISDADQEEIYKEAFSELMMDWESWADLD